MHRPSNPEFGVDEAPRPRPALQFIGWLVMGAVFTSWAAERWAQVAGTADRGDAVVALVVSAAALAYYWRAAAVLRARRRARSRRV